MPVRGIVRAVTRIDQTAHRLIECFAGVVLRYGLNQRLSLGVVSVSLLPKTGYCWARGAALHWLAP